MTKIFDIKEIISWPISEDGWHMSPDGEKIFVGARASISAWASIGDGARIGDRANFPKSPLYIIGTRHLVFETKPGIISVRGQNHEIGWWLENYHDFGHKNGYSDAEIAEYKSYIDLYYARCNQYTRTVKTS